MHRDDRGCLGIMEGYMKGDVPVNYGNGGRMDDPATAAEMLRLIEAGTYPNDNRFAMVVPVEGGVMSSQPPGRRCMVRAAPRYVHPHPWSTVRRCRGARSAASHAPQSPSTIQPRVTGDENDNDRSMTPALYATQQCTVCAGGLPGRAASAIAGGGG
jgi:hypothetical protein